MEPTTTTPIVPTADSPHPTDAASSRRQTEASTPASPDPHLVAFVAGTDHPCPNCGYNLRGLRASVCPECSQLLKLTIGLVEPKLGTWMAAVLGLAVGAGFSLMMVGYLLFQIVLRGRRSEFRHSETFFVVILPAVIMSACLLVLLRNRGRFRKYPLLGRIALAVACWLLTLANLTVFSLVID